MSTPRVRRFGRKPRWGFRQARRKSCHPDRAAQPRMLGRVAERRTRSIFVLSIFFTPCPPRIGYADSPTKHYYLMGDTASDKRVPRSKKSRNSAKRPMIFSGTANGPRCPPVGLSSSEKKVLSSRPRGAAAHVGPRCRAQDTVDFRSFHIFYTVSTENRLCRFSHKALLSHGRYSEA